MQPDTNCQVCGSIFAKYRSLSGHLRWKNDPEHRVLRIELKNWLRKNRVLRFRCSKCGDLWEAREHLNRKRCDRCQKDYETLSKRQYEAIRYPNRPTGYVYRVKSDEIKKGKLGSAPAWSPEDEVYSDVLAAVLDGESFQSIRKRSGVTFDSFRGILLHAWGDVKYAEWAAGRKSDTGVNNIKIAHRKYRELSVSAKEALFQNRDKAHKLERLLLDQLRRHWGGEIALNVWQCVPIDGVLVPREADLKITASPSHKIVVMCDGEAFHGPKTIFGDPVERMVADIATTVAYAKLGYSVLRYSESEIHANGAAPDILSVLTHPESWPCVRSWL